MMDTQAEATAAARRTCAALEKYQPTLDEELALGKRLALANAGQLYLDAPDATLPTKHKNAVTAHVALVGKTLASGSARPDLAWTFGVIARDEVATSSTPGGYVFVTTGLLRKLTNEAQLAAVLAHEIAHVNARTMLLKHRDAKFKQCVALTQVQAMAAASGNPTLVAQMANVNLEGPFVTQLLDTTLRLGNDRQAELDADKTALELVAFAGYDAAEFEALLLRLEPWPLHPTTAERVAHLQALRRGELKAFLHGTAKPDLEKPFAALRN